MEMDELVAKYAPPPPPPGSGGHYLYYYHTPPPPPPPHHHHQLVQPYYPQPLPPPPSSYSPYAAAPRVSQAAYDEVRTLFVAGFPEDVKPREIYNLFREFQGYESSHLRTPSAKSQPFAFAVFLDQQSAIGAMQALNRMKDMARIRKLDVRHIQGLLLILVLAAFTCLEWLFQLTTRLVIHLHRVVAALVAVV